jgi:hypothetical protein
MGTYMINTESILESDHFVMLDVVNTVSGNEFDRSCPKVQIVYPSSMNSFPDIKVTGSHPENRLTHKERRKYLSAITLNLDADY